MTRTTELFERPFMLTGEQTDPRDRVFATMTHELLVSNSDGTPAVKSYFMVYDPNGNRFNSLAVRCTYSYEQQPARRLEVTEWFYDDGTIGATRELYQVTQIQ